MNACRAAALEPARVGDAARRPACRRRSPASPARSCRRGTASAPRRRRRAPAGQLLAAGRCCASRALASALEVELGCAAGAAATPTRAAPRRRPRSSSRSVPAAPLRSGRSRTMSATRLGAPLEQVDRVGQRLVRGAQARRAIRGRGERAQQLVLGLDRRSSGRLAALPAERRRRSPRRARPRRFAAAGLSRSPPARRRQESTAAVPATDASHHPARRSGIMLERPRRGRRQHVGQQRAVDRPRPRSARRRPRRTPRRRPARSRARRAPSCELTAVPIAISTLPASASARCAVSFSRRVPPKDTSTSVAKPPKAANVAIWRLSSTWSANANRPGTTIAARTARSAAGRDHTGRQLAATERQLDDRPRAATVDKETPPGTWCESRAASAARAGAPAPAGPSRSPQRPSGRYGRRTAPRPRTAAAAPWPRSARRGAVRRSGAGR